MHNHHSCEICTLILKSAAEVRLNCAQQKKKLAKLHLCRAGRGWTFTGWVHFIFCRLGEISCFDKPNPVWRKMCILTAQRNSGTQPLHWILCTWPLSLSRPWWLYCCCYAKLCFIHMVKGLDKSKTNEHLQNSQNSISAFFKIKFFKFSTYRETQFQDLILTFSTFQ